MRKKSLSSLASSLPTQVCSPAPHGGLGMAARWAADPSGWTRRNSLHPPALSALTVPSHSPSSFRCYHHCPDLNLLFFLYHSHDALLWSLRSTVLWIARQMLSIECFISSAAANPLALTVEGKSTVALIKRLLHPCHSS